MRKTGLRTLARDKLLELYHHEKVILGHDPSEQEFFPVDLRKLARILLPQWQLIELSDLREADVPISGRTDFERHLIYVNAGDGARQRYTLAHELGHIVLNHGGCKKYRLDTGPRSILRPDQLEPADPSQVAREREADAFAAELLMPERTVQKEFRRRFAADRLWIKSHQAELVLKTIIGTASDAAAALAISRYPNNSPPLTEFFGVSAKAMSTRLLELGLVH